MYVLKVGSCPNDDNFVHFFFGLFLCSIQVILFSESVPVKKTTKFCGEFAFSCLFISFVLGFRLSK